jgi:hypothetical protein
MPPRRSARVAAEADRAATALSPLPHAVVLAIFARLPADVRARCALVCRGWRAVVSEPSLWTRLDLSPSSGVSVAVTDAVLFAAAARARGGLTALDVSGGPLRADALRRVLAEHGGALTQLRSVEMENTIDVHELESLLTSAPRLTRWRLDRDCSAAEALRVLRAREQPAFARCAVRRLRVSFHGHDAAADGAAAHADEEDADGRHAALRAVLDAVRAHAGGGVTWLELVNAPLGAPGALDDVVDAALDASCSSLRTLVLSDLTPAAAPPLARLLRAQGGGGALRTLDVANGNTQAPLLDGPAAALLGDALRTNATLTTLSLCAVSLWSDPPAAAALLRALTGHASLRTLRFFNNPLDALYNAVDADAAAVAAAALSVISPALGALVAANAPSLTALDLRGCELRDEGLAGLCAALPGNARLRVLNVSHNFLSVPFAADALLRAVRANRSLRRFGPCFHPDAPGAFAAAALVARRAADAGWTDAPEAQEE